MSHLDPSHADPTEPVEPPSLPGAAAGEIPRLHGVPSRYQQLGLLGEGGMGRVWRVFDPDLEREVALKVLKAGSAGKAHRLLAEARVMARLQHPNILPVHEVGTTDEGRPYYTMPVVRGRSLRSVLDGLAEGDAALAAEYTLPRLMQVLVQICHAVEFAHDGGVLHRDLKPGNVMLGTHGEVLVLDWGLASRPGEQEPGCEVFGTPAYMAPEQARGLPLDARCDVWALGVILFEMLALERPLRGEPAQILAALGCIDIPRPGQRAGSRPVPLELEEACLLALIREREERLARAGELGRRIARWLEAESDRTLRHARAEEKAEEGERGLAEHLRLKAERDALLARLTAVGKQRSASPEEAEERLDLLRTIEWAERRLDRSAAEALGALAAALGFEPDNRRARAALAEFHWARHREAQEALDEPEAVFHLGQVAAYQDGRFARELAGTGSLQLASDPPGALVFLHPLVEDGFVLRPGFPSPLGRTPLGALPLDMGGYLLRVVGQDLAELLYPVHITRNREWRAELRLPPASAIPAGFRLIPAGPFALGGDPGCRGWAAAREERSLPDFLIAEHPVTLAEYLEFLDELRAAEGPEAALRRAPRERRDHPTWLLRRADGGLAVPEFDGSGLPLDPRSPARGVSWEDAAAYCAWRAAREGRTWRLPSEEEWEKAARGVDGRAHPWGRWFDRSLANIRGSLQGPPRAVAVDLFPEDRSIYGVRGLGGNVRDWTSASGAPGSPRGGRVVKGGAWNLGRVHARSANRSSFEPGFVSAVVGFRLAASV